MFVAFSAWLVRVLCVYTLTLATSVPTLKTPSEPCQIVHSLPFCPPQVPNCLAHDARARALARAFLLIGVEIILLFYLHMSKKSSTFASSLK